MKNVKLDIQRFGHTNSTTNYGYPQFVGTDKPGWLTDINGAFNDIDEDIKTAQTSADSAQASATIADGKAVQAQSDATTALNSAGTANTNIGTMANLTTSDKSSIVGATNEINAKATQNTTDIAKLNLNTFESYETSDVIITGGNVSASYASLTVASNSDGSVGKVYGQIELDCSSLSSGTTVTVKLGTTNLNPTSDISIKCAGIMYYTRDNSVFSKDIYIKTNGDVEFTAYCYANGGTIRIILSPCLYFMKDFGDTPTP